MSIGIPGIGIGLRAGGSGVDADAAAWAAAVVANGGTYSAATLAAVSTFVKAAKASGYWTKLNRINLFCGNQLAAALVPLKVGGGSATDTNVNFVAGDYSEATGLTGNGATKYLRTGLIPSASLSLNSTHISLYNRQETSGTAGPVLGSRTAAASSFALFSPSSTGSAAISDAYGTTTGRLTTTLSAPFGFVIASRTAADSHVTYQNGASVGSNAVSEGSLPNIECYIGSLNIGGVANGFTAHPLAGYSFGSGLTAAEVAAYSTHMEVFQDALGRGVQA